MKYPMSSRERLGSHDLVLMSRKDHVLPSSVDVAWNVSTRTSFVSWRLSNQTVWSVPSAPEGAAAIHGKNWSLRAGRPFALTLSVRTLPHVLPWSTDRTNEMSAPDVSRCTPFWNT